MSFSKGIETKIVDPSLHVRETRVELHNVVSDRGIRPPRNVILS